MSDFGLLIHRYMRYDSGTVTSAEAEFSCNEVVLKPYWIISKLTVQYNTAAADIDSGKLTYGLGGREVGQSISEICDVEQQTCAI